jgi:hypothetical protein
VRGNRAHVVSTVRRTESAAEGGCIPRLQNALVTDAKEVGVGNPAEETFCHQDTPFNAQCWAAVKPPEHNYFWGAIVGSRKIELQV